MATDPVLDTPDPAAPAPDLDTLDPRANARAQIGFDPFGWFWTFQNGDVFDPRRFWLRLPNADPAYRDFLAKGYPLTKMHVDADGTDSLEALQTAILDHYGLHATLAHYAGTVRWMKVQEPVTLSFGGKAYRFQTDDVSSTKVSKAIQLGKALEERNGAGTFKTKWKTADGFTEVALGIADLESIGVAVGLHEAGYFDREATVDALIAAGTIRTPEDVDAAFADPA